MLDNGATLSVSHVASQGTSPVSVQWLAPMDEPILEDGQPPQHMPLVQDQHRNSKTSPNWEPLLPPYQQQPSEIAKISTDNGSVLLKGAGSSGRAESLSVHGRLAAHAHFWRSIGASPVILHIIMYGYYIPLVSYPPLLRAKNLVSAFKHSTFINEQIAALCGAGAIEQVSQESLHAINPLGVVPKKNNKLRMILDLRALNKFVHDQHFRCEDARMIPELFQKGCFMFNFDLKDGYHHVSVAPEHRKFLGFSWQSKHYQFAALPFGLKSAPFIFTKLLRPLVAYWRSKGIRMFMYLDDGTVGSASREEAEVHAAIIQQDIQAAGLVVNSAKSNFQPRQKIECLGHVIDSAENKITITEERVSACKRLLVEVASAGSQLSARKIAKLTGSLCSMWLAMGNIVHLQTRAMYDVIAHRALPSWDSVVELNDACLKELVFWLDNFDVFHGRPIWVSSPQVISLVWCDASDSGWGGFCAKDGGQIARGDFPWSIIKQSSTTRELLAVRYTLAFDVEFTGKPAGMHSNG